MNILKNFIETELLLRAKHYEEAPASIIEHYNIEQGNIQAYNGRQLLEMLQNADDASEQAKEKKVLIKLDREKLIIANNGEPFSKEGFQSIIYSNLSPKAMLQNKIGQKGLGFRSILSWSKEIVINSGGTKLVFSESIAQKFLVKLINKAPGVSIFLKNNSKSEFPIATLRVPELLNGIEESERYFDTIIEIILKENVFSEVQSQIMSIINKETLIFLNHIETIEIDSPERKITFNKYISNNEVIIKSQDFMIDFAETKKWNIKKKIGIHKEKKYELAIAWNDELNDNKNVLFSYFQTEVRFPFPALLHGTFELTLDRNQLEKDIEGHNEFLIGKLSELLIETALEIAKINSEATYLPLRLLNIDFDKVDNNLRNFKFKERLIEKIKLNNVFPTVNKSYISYNDRPVYYDYPIALIAYGEDVKNLMPVCDDKSVVEFVKSFKIFEYNAKWISKIIAKRANKIDIVELAKLFFYFLETDVFPKGLNSDKFKLSELDAFLLDSDNKIISWDSNIFIQPEENYEYKLPKSLNIRFLNLDFVDTLLKELCKENIELLLNKLKPFGIKKYSFSEVSETTIHHFCSRESLETKDIIELHSFMFHLFKSELLKKEPSQLSYEINTPVISVKKRINKAKEVYFGAQYGNVLTEQLFNYDKTKLLASPQEYGLESEDATCLKKYFKWIGVAELPRKIIANAPTEFAEYALKKYDYHNKIGNHHYNSYENFKFSLRSYGKITIQSIDEFDGILNNNNCELIIAWLCEDNKIYELLEHDSEPIGSMIEIYLGNDRYCREITGNQIRNFLKWKLSNSVWLDTESGIKQAPIFCTTSATISVEFSPLIEKPNIDYDANIFKNNKISHDKIDYLLNIVGVNRTISFFETKILYSILNKLPEIDPLGKKAKTLYRELAVNYDEKNLDISEIEYKKFIKEGKVLSKRHNEFRYEKNNLVFYVDNKRYGESIINQFHTIDIERRKNQEKIEKVFGVKPLKELRLTLANNPNLHILNGKFEEEIESFKPYVYVFRQDLDTTGKEKNIIKDVRFKLVTDLSVLLEIDKEKLQFSLSRYEYVYLPINKTVYIRISENINDEKNLKEDINFCSTIAEAFSALIDVDAQRQQIRELFSKSIASRDDIIRVELDDENLEKLLLSKDKLGIVSDPKIQFWLSFIKCFPLIKIPKENFTDESLLNELVKLFPEYSEIISGIFDQINYDYFNEETSLRLIVDLLNKSNISLQNFNRYAYPSIDISELYDLDFKRIKEDKRIEFKQTLYFLFINSDKDKKDFLKILYQFDSLRSNFQDETNYNVEADLSLQLQKQFNIQLSDKFEFNFEEIYSANKTLYELESEKQHISKEVANQFLNENSELESLLYFRNEVNVLIERLKDWVPKTSEGNTNNGIKLAKKRIAIGNSAFFYDDFKDLFNQLENDAIFRTNISKIKIKKMKSEDSSSNNKKKPSIKYQRRIKQPTEELGFLGEFLVYKHLLNSLNKIESIKWVSEYAKLAGVNSDGKDGWGYDIVYIPNDAKYPRYVEVKLVNWENAFHITSNEIIQGEKLKNHYEIFLVRNINEPDDIIIEIIQGPFYYKGQSSFNDNELFTVVNDSFILKFEKTDE